jgi:hypothetical protein
VEGLLSQRKKWSRRTRTLTDEAYMKSHSAILMVGLALGLCQPSRVAAQAFFQNPQSPGIFNNQMSALAGRGEVQGIFGSQMAGTPLRAPVQSIFGPQTLGLSMASYSNRFGGRTLVNSVADFSNPGGVYGPTPLGQQVLYQIPPMALVPPDLTPAPPAQTFAPVYNMTEVQAAPEAASQTSPDAKGTEGAEQTAEGQTAAPAAAPAFPYATQSRANTPAANASFARPQSFARSPELSERLTRIARQRGMLAGQGIDVYLGDRVAVLKGVVRTSGDRSLLANVVGLEPEVQYVDNRLSTDGGNSLSANRVSP